MNAETLRDYLNHVLTLAAPAADLLPARYRAEALEALQVLRHVVDDSEVIDILFTLLQKKGVI